MYQCLKGNGFCPGPWLQCWWSCRSSVGNQPWPGGFSNLGFSYRQPKVDSWILGEWSDFFPRSSQLLLTICLMLLSSGWNMITKMDLSFWVFESDWVVWRRPSSRSVLPFQEGWWDNSCPWSWLPWTSYACQSQQVCCRSFWREETDCREYCPYMWVSQRIQKVIVHICRFTVKVYVDLAVNDGDHGVQEVDTVLWNFTSEFDVRVTSVQVVNKTV